MRSPRLWVIDPSLRHAEGQGVREAIGDWPGTSRVFEPALRPGDGPSPRTGHDTDAVIVLGSAASVHDAAPWIDDLGAWLVPLVDGSRPLPLLAVCFGHQLVAHVAGGAVGWVHPDRSKIVGVDSVGFRGSRLIEDDACLRVVFSHREEVTTAGRGFGVVAARTPGRLDGLEHAELPAFTFQFHPEARDEFAGRAGIEPREIDSRLVRDSSRLLAAFRATATRRALEGRADGEPADDPPAHRGS